MYRLMLTVNNPGEISLVFVYNWPQRHTNLSNISSVLFLYQSFFLTAGTHAVKIIFISSVNRIFQGSHPHFCISQLIYWIALVWYILLKEVHVMRRTITLHCPLVSYQTIPQFISNIYTYLNEINFLEWQTLTKETRHNHHYFMYHKSQPYCIIIININSKALQNHFKGVKNSFTNYK